MIKLDRPSRQTHHFSISYTRDTVPSRRIQHGQGASRVHDTARSAFSSGTRTATCTSTTRLASYCVFRSRGSTIRGNLEDIVPSLIWGILWSTENENLEHQGKYQVRVMALQICSSYSTVSTPYSTSPVGLWWCCDVFSRSSVRSGGNSPVRTPNLLAVGSSLLSPSSLLTPISMIHIHSFQGFRVITFRVFYIASFLMMFSWIEPTLSRCTTRLPLVRAYCYAGQPWPTRARKRHG